MPEIPSVAIKAVKHARREGNTIIVECKDLLEECLKARRKGKHVKPLNIIKFSNRLPTKRRL